MCQRHQAEFNCSSLEIPKLSIPPGIEKLDSIFLPGCPDGTAIHLVVLTCVYLGALTWHPSFTPHRSHCPSPKDRQERVAGPFVNQASPPGPLLPPLCQGKQPQPWGLGPPATLHSPVGHPPLSVPSLSREAQSQPSFSESTGSAARRLPGTGRESTRCKEEALEAGIPGSSAWLSVSLSLLEHLTVNSNNYHIKRTPTGFSRGIGMKWKRRSENNQEKRCMPKPGSLLPPPPPNTDKEVITTIARKAQKWTAWKAQFPTWKPGACVTHPSERSVGPSPVVRTHSAWAAAASRDLPGKLKHGIPSPGPAFLRIPWEPVRRPTPSPDS